MPCRALPAPAIRILTTPLSRFSVVWHWMVDLDASKPGWVHVQWMPPIIFVCFFVALHCLAYIVAEYLDRPATKWIASQLSEKSKPEGDDAGGDKKSGAI